MNALEYNRYIYCCNDPLNYTDPTGYVRVKTDGQIFTIHKGDADTLYFHAHNYELNQKVNLSTGDIYSCQTGKVVGNVGTKVLTILNRAAERAGIIGGRNGGIGAGIINFFSLIFPDWLFSITIDSNGDVGSPDPETSA